MKPLRILVVDDDLLIGDLLSEMLAEMGHEVCGLAMTESGAIAAAGRCHPDLMIVDARLGRGSGLAAMRAILRNGPMPHVFISGASVQADSPDAIILQKPFREQQLARAIDRAMGAVEAA